MSDKDRAEAAERRLNMLAGELAQARSQIAQLEKNKQDLNKTIYWLLTIQKAYWTRQGQRGDDV